MPSSTWVIQHRDGLGPVARAALIGAVVLTHVVMAVTVAHLSRQEIHEPTISAMTVQWISPVQAPVPPPPEPVKIRQVEPPKPRKQTIVAAKPPVPTPAPVFQAPEPPKEEPKVVDNSPPLPPAPPAPAPPPAPKQVEVSSISDLNCYFMPLADYPLASRRRREEGRTVVDLTIDTRGLVTTVSVAKSSGYARLDSAALDSVRQYRCKPRMEAGVAQIVRTTAPIDFELQ